MNEDLKEFLTIDDLDVEDKTILFRADINTVVVDGKVQMKERIEENAKTIRELSAKKAKIVSEDAGGACKVNIRAEARATRRYLHK